MITWLDGIVGFCNDLSLHVQLVFITTRFGLLLYKFIRIEVLVAILTAEWMELV
jgi:hypothetical protein